MKIGLYQNKIFVKKSRMHGYGVFAGKKIRKGEKIEECYVLISKGGDKTLEDYYFDVKAKQGRYALFTGYGSIYNHSNEPNAEYFINARKRIATIIATTTIQEGEEIYVSYGEEWFTSRDLKPKKPPKV